MQESSGTPIATSGILSVTAEGVSRVVAGEITIRNFIAIRRGNLVYSPPQAQFTADLTNSFGPSPGAITATYDGTDIDLSGFTDPGWMHIYNQEDDDGATVSVGIVDPDTDRYYPFFQLQPGWHATLCLDELIGGEFYPATGTGSAGGGNRLRVKAKEADTANVFVGVFER